MLFCHKIKLNLLLFYGILLLSCSKTKNNTISKIEAAIQKTKQLEFLQYKQTLKFAFSNDSTHFLLNCYQSHTGGSSFRGVIVSRELQLNRKSFYYFVSDSFYLKKSDYQSQTDTFLNENYRCLNSIQYPLNELDSKSNGYIFEKTETLEKGKILQVTHYFTGKNPKNTKQVSFQIQNDLVTSIKIILNNELIEYAYYKLIENKSCSDEMINDMLGPKQILYKSDHLKNINLQSSLDEHFSILNLAKLSAYTIINFSPPSCFGCNQNLIAENALFKSYKQKNVNLVLINPNGSDSNPSYWDEIQKKNGFQFSVYTTSKNVLNQLQLTGFPSYFIINNKGDILYRGMDYSVVEQKIKALVE